MAFRILALIGLFSSTAMAAEGPTTTLTVTLVDLHSDKGQVACELFLGPKGYPKDASLAVQKLWVPIAGGAAKCVFPGVVPGAYAVAAFHDENGNGKLDTNFLGIPKEGLAASNDARGKMGPPSFDDAKLDVGKQDLAITVHVHY